MMLGPQLSSMSQPSSTRCELLTDYTLRGAVLSRLPQEASVISSQAPRHYGVSAMEIYDEAIDKGQPKVFDLSDGQNRAKRVTFDCASFR
jgi:hypothetical protein